MKFSILPIRALVEQDNRKGIEVWWHVTNSTPWDVLKESSNKLFCCLFKPGMKGINYTNPKNQDMKLSKWKLLGTWKNPVAGISEKIPIGFRYKL